MSHRLNLAKRPFVNTKPVNVVAGVLGITTLILTFASWQTVSAYLTGSQKARDTLAGIRREISTLEAARDEAQRRLGRHDLEELANSSEDALWIAQKKAFSWTRFLTRLEAVLPGDIRAVSVELTRNEPKLEGTSSEEMPVSLRLISRDPNGLPKVIRAFYSSEFFDRPQPIQEIAPKEGTAEGTQLNIKVVYVDGGEKKK